jgi:hypothetical protein
MPCTGPVQQEVLAQILRQRTASEYRKTRRGRSPCGPSAQAREPRRGLIKINKAPAPARGADQTAPPDNAPRRGEARKGNIPRGPLSAPIEKRPPRARRPALPQPGAAVLSAKAGLTAGFGMGPGDPRLCGRARGGRSPAAQMYSSLPGTPVRGDPGGRMAGTEEDHASRSVL